MYGALCAVHCKCLTYSISFHCHHELLREVLLLLRKATRAGGGLAQAWLRSLHSDCDAPMLPEVPLSWTKMPYGSEEGEVWGPTDVRLRSGPAA